jgi:hypothetical protein
MEVFVARSGLTARGIVYILMGFLALLISRGRNTEVDQKSALAQVLVKPYGFWLVALLAVGFISYALWRFYEAFTAGTAKRKQGPRILLFVRGVIYASLAYSALSLLNGSREHQSTQQRDIALTVMSHSGGRWLVGLVGFIVVAVGLRAVWEGVQLKFMQYFQRRHISPAVRSWIRSLGRIGTISRGIVFTITGGLVVSAAWTHDASKATGLDAAVKTLRNQPYGKVLLGVVAIGLIIFGIYGLAEARYRDI